MFIGFKVVTFHQINIINSILQFVTAYTQSFVNDRLWILYNTVLLLLYFEWLPYNILCICEDKEILVFN